MKRVLSVLGSIPFFFAILVAIVALSAFATIAPAPGVFRSPLFLVLGVALELSLIACVLPRSIRRIRERNFKPTKLAADIVHLGLIVLIAAGVLSLSVGRRELFALSPGDSGSFGAVRFTLIDTSEVYDEEGVLQDWDVRLKTNAGPREISINNPATVEGVRFHLFNWDEEEYITLAEEDGPGHRIRQGEGLEAPDGTRFIFLETSVDGAAIFAVFPPGSSLGNAEAERMSLAPGDTLGGLRYRPGGTDTTVVLQASYNPARGAVTGQPHMLLKE